MHELSIAQSLIELACEAVERQRGETVQTLHVRIGALSGVVQDALLFAFEVAAEGTSCENAELVIDEVAIRVNCPKCQIDTPPVTPYCLVCPQCGSATPKIVCGQELELVSMELVTHAAESA